MTDISGVIKMVVSQYDEDPYEINNGLCEEFMKDVVSKVSEAEECSTGLVLENGYMKYPIHVWVFCDGMHYDAECPEGVDDFLGLPFFKNNSVREILNCNDLKESRFTENTFQNITCDE